jgi:hypothetical protein
MKCKKCNEEIVGGFWENNGLVCGHCHIAKPMLALRDQFAMHCPKYWIDRISFDDMRDMLGLSHNSEVAISQVMLCEIKLRYRYADIMLAEREKK